MAESDPPIRYASRGASRCTQPRAARRRYVWRPLVWRRVGLVVAVVAVFGVAPYLLLKRITPPTQPSLTSGLAEYLRVLAVGLRDYEADQGRYPPTLQHLVHYGYAGRLHLLPRPSPLGGSDPNWDAIERAVHAATQPSERDALLAQAPCDFFYAAYASAPASDADWPWVWIAPEDASGVAVVILVSGEVLELSPRALHLLLNERDSDHRALRHAALPIVRPVR